MHRLTRVLTLTFLYGLLYVPLSYIPLSLAQSNSSHFMGVAKDPSSKQVLYKEIHCLSTKPETRLNQGKVLYLNPANEIIATKYLNNTENNLLTGKNQSINPAWVPQYEFVHHDLGFAEALRFSKDKILLRRKESETADWEEKLLLPDTDYAIIADAGFDRFVRENLASVIAGEDLDVTYLSAPRLTAINFSIKTISQTEEVIELSLAPRNLVIRLLVDPIKLVYHKESQRLLSFEGLTNVPKKGGENYVALIEYRYGENLNEFCS